MELSEEQKARASALADAVGEEPGKYFVGILSAATEKYFNIVLELLKSGKAKLYEKYPKIKEQAEQASVDLEVTKEAYRIWYEKSGKNLMDREKELIKNTFDRAVLKLQIFVDGIKYTAEKIIADLKKE